MKLFTINVILALVWALLLGEITLSTLLTGFILAYLILFLLFRRQVEHSYFKRVPRFFTFILYYLWELFRSNLIIAWDVLTPTHHMRPGIIAIPLEAESDVEITVLANLITMTPGTLSLDVSDDRKVLYIHAMYVTDPDEVRAEVKQELERRVLEFLR